MSHEKATEELHSSVGELTNLMNDTFTCCMRNYEALLPYLEKKETKLKVYQRLLQINVLLNKLNEELVGLRVEYVTVSLCEQKRETGQSDGGRKRRTSDMSEAGRHEAKSIKTEVPFSSNTKCSIALTSEAEISKKSDNVVPVNSKEVSHTQVQKSDMYRTTNIKTEILDSNEVGDLLVFSEGNSENPAAQTSCDTRNNREMVPFRVDEITSVSDRLVRDKACDKLTNTLSQRENSEEYIPLQNVKRDTTNEEIANVLSTDRGIHRGLGVEVDCTTSASYQPKRHFNSKESPVGFTTFDKESAMLVERRPNSYDKRKRRARSPIRCEKDQVELFSPGHELYGVIKYENGKLKCMLCNRELPYYSAVHSHVNGMKHKRNQVIAEQTGCAKNCDVAGNNCDTIASVTLCATVTCSLADTIVIVENSQSDSMEHAVKLDDMWKYFSAPFQINQKYFKVHSGLVICSLCNLHVGEYILSIKLHIITPSHMKRLKRLTDFEISCKSKNKQMLKAPGLLNKFLPKTQFTLENDGFFCKLCKYFCVNDTVLNHLTSKRHNKMVRKMKK